MNDAQILAEIGEVQADLGAFLRARDAIQRRIIELEETPGRHENFIKWAGTQAVMSVLIMCIVRCEGLIEDYTQALTENQTKH